MVFTQKKVFAEKMASQGADAWAFNTMKCNSEHPDSGAAAGPNDTGSLGSPTCDRECLTLEERENETMGSWKGPERRKRRIWESKPGRKEFIGERETKKEIKANGKERKAGNMQE